MSCTPPDWIYYNETLHNDYLLNYISAYFFHTFNYKTCYRFQFTSTLQQTYTYVYLPQYIIIILFGWWRRNGVKTSGRFSIIIEYWVSQVKIIWKYGNSFFYNTHIILYTWYYIVVVYSWFVHTLNLLK